MASAPKSLTQQSRFADQGEASADDSVASDDHPTDAPSGSNEGTSVDPKAEGHYGRFKRNPMTHWRVEER